METFTIILLCTLFCASLAFTCTQVDQNCSCTTGNGQSCNDDVVKKCDEGTVQSPNYPATCNSNKDLTWTIEVPDGFRIKLTFAKLFELESHKSCSYDSLKIYDVISERRSILKGSWCGNTAPPDKIKISLSSKVKVIFHSDDGVNYKGFSISWNRVDVDECKVDNGGCDQACTNTEGSWTCSSYETAYSCPCGWVFFKNNCYHLYQFKKSWNDAKTFCESKSAHLASIFDVETNIFLSNDIDECKIKNGGCEQICTNTEGSRNCSCTVGYTKNVQKCEDIDECKIHNGGCQQKCTNSIGSWNCSCHSGYMKHGQSCDDIDECQVNNGGCQQTCTNTEGSRNCSCNSGYTINGQSCDDIDECQVKNGGCQQTCTNTDGSRNCSCNSGYTINGQSCDDIDECQVKNGGCEQICTNTEGSWDCSCNVGYTKNVQKCEDIDECKIHNGGCQQICTNSIGSWNCSCHTGYMKHGQSCDDIDECQVNNGGCQQTCTNTEGSRNCSCNSGYTINGQSCDDIDECKIKNGGCEQICTNTESSWNCSCNAGYTINGQSCEVVTTKETTNPTTTNTETEAVSMKQVTSSISSVSGDAQKSQSQIAGLHYGAFAGIIGGILVLIAIVTGSVLVMKRRRREANIHSPSEGYKNAMHDSTTVQSLEMNVIGDDIPSDC